MRIRIATRRSPLAQWQSRHVGDALRHAHGVDYELVTLETFADTRLDLPISELGGKGAFSKEVQARVLAGQADLAVHSAKDLQAVTPDGLVIGAYPPRGDARDALVGATLDELGPGSVVATGSSRRRAQLRHLQPDLEFRPLRGNIATRLARAVDHDAIVVAGVALERLGERPPVVDLLPVDVMVPQVGQGALAVECRADDDDTLALLSDVDHAATRRRVEAERAFLVTLGGDCDLPAGAHAHLSGDELRLTAVLAPPDEATLARSSTAGSDGAALGARLATELRQQVGR